MLDRRAPLSRLCRLSPPRKRSDSRSKSGTPSRSGLGISWWIIVRFAGTISWISASNVRLIKLVQPARNAPLLGEFAIMHSTSTALAGGSRLVKSVLLITASGSFRNMVIRIPCRKIWGVLILPTRLLNSL